MSNFNSDAFLQTTVEGANSTVEIPVPAGEYQAQAKKPTARQFNKDDGTSYTVLSIPWKILDEGVKKVTHRDEPVAFQSVFLDMTAQGGIDMGPGKNIDLGLVRAALGQNKADKRWSFSMIEGGMATVRIEQKPNRKDPEKTDANVVRVTKL